MTTVESPSHRQNRIKHPLLLALGVFLVAAAAIIVGVVLGSGHSTDWHTLNTAHTTVKTASGNKHFDLQVQSLGSATTKVTVTNGTSTTGQRIAVVHAKQPILRVVVVPTPDSESAALLQPSIAAAKQGAISAINTELTVMLEHRFGKQPFMLSYAATK